jgi:hypothetical protein
MVVCICLITDAHEYGLPMLAVQKCLEIHHPFRNLHDFESFVKFELMSSAGIGNRLFPYLAAIAIAYRFNKMLHYTFAIILIPQAFELQASTIQIVSNFLKTK